MRANRVARRSFRSEKTPGTVEATRAKKTAAERAAELCSVCHHEDTTSMRRLIAGMCHACYGWWGHTSLLAPREMSDYLSYLTLKADRYSNRSGILQKRPQALPTIKHKTS